MIAFLRSRLGVAVRQHDASDCGAACLASVAAYHGRRTGLSRVRQLCGTDADGTDLLGLLEAATRLGFRARGVRGPPEAIGAIPVPAIAHMDAGGTPHFVVVYSVERRTVRVMDPADGSLRRVPHARFLAAWSGALLLIAPDGGLPPGELARGTLPRLAALMRPHRADMLQAFAGSVATTLLGLSGAVFVQQIVDGVLPADDPALLRVLGAAMLALLAAELLLQSLREMMLLGVGQRIDAGLLLGYYRHLLALPQRFFDTMRVGEILSRMNDAVRVRALLTDVALDVLVGVSVVACATALLFVHSRPLGLLLLAALPCYAAVLLLANRTYRPAERRVTEAAAELESHLVESLGAVAAIRLVGAEAHLEQQAEFRLVRLLRAAHGAGGRAVLAATSMEALSRLATIGILWAGAAQVLDRALTPGALMSCYAVIGYLTGPLNGLIHAGRSLQQARIAADRLFDVLDLEREDRSGTIELTPANLGDIQFEGVSFRYGSRAPVFRGLTLTLPRGKLTAVVGDSGCGKSTMASLLLGLYPVDEGRIRIGEVEVRYLTTGSVRRMIGAVPQRIDLLPGSIAENVALGEHEPDLERVMAVAREVGLAEWVEGLPSGYHTRLGEGGALPSGGQRQRIGIARGLYRDPQVLILDESTSSLDPRAEATVRAAVRRFLGRGRTVVVIAHDPADVPDADHVVVLACGHAAEHGTHPRSGAASAPEEARTGEPAACT